jgi:hypothetical protein
MDDVSNKTNAEIEADVHQIKSAFNKSLENEGEQNTTVSIISVLPKRITIGKPTRATEVTFECTSNDETAQLVFGAVCLYFAHVNAHPNEYGENKLREISDRFPKLTEFLNQYEINKSKFKIIKNFETYLVEKGTNGGSATLVLFFIKSAKSLTSLKTEQITVLQAIESATKLNPIGKEQKPLTNWFSQKNWLRAKMAQEGKADVYQRLASSKLLMQSFKQTIAELMLILQEVSRDLSDTLKQNDFDVAIVNSIITDKNKQDRYHKFQREVLYAVTRNTTIVEKQTLEVLLHDFCTEARKNYVVTALSKTDDIVISEIVEKKRLFSFRKAVIFDAAFINQLEKFLKGEQTSYPVSKAEEICFYWLNCALTVQASDARKLEYSDFIFHGTATKTTHLSCDYYKSRAQDFKTTDTLDTTQPVGKAIFKFLHNRKSVDELTSITLNDVDLSGFSRTGAIGRMFALLSEGSCHQRVKKRLLQQQVSSVFLSLINCVLNNADLTIGEWVNLRKKLGHADKSIETYQKLVKYWVPTNWFTGSMIKTAAVHASSNAFRVGTLVNNNSHSSSLEHDVYFSEQNQEHQSTAARLMRLVMNDIENVAFKPNVIELKQKISERQIRTKLVSETSGTVLPFVERDENKELTVTDEDEDEEGDAINVIDSVETVVNFLHYIKQAEKNYKALATHNPTYLEKYVLVEAEWKEYVLNNLISKQIKTDGYAAYEQYKSMLPDLFLSQIRA